MPLTIASKQAMFCETCGFEVEEEDTFCRKCGRAVRGAAPAYRARLCTRTRQGRLLAGVCAGYAKHFAKDVRIVRIIWTLSALIPPFFPGVAAYLISWLLLPAPRDSTAGHAPASE